MSLSPSNATYVVMLLPYRTVAKRQRCAPSTGLSAIVRRLVRWLQRYTLLSRLGLNGIGSPPQLKTDDPRWGVRRCKLLQLLEILWRPRVARVSSRLGHGNPPNSRMRYNDHVSRVEARSSYDSAALTRRSPTLIAS